MTFRVEGNLERTTREKQRLHVSPGKRNIFCTVFLAPLAILHLHTCNVSVMLYFLASHMSLKTNTYLVFERQNEEKAVSLKISASMAFLQGKNQNQNKNTTQAGLCRGRGRKDWLFS